MPEIPKKMKALVARSPGQYAIEWIACGKLPTSGVVSHVFKLDDWQEAFELAASGANATRVVIVPN